MNFNTFNLNNTLDQITRVMGDTTVRDTARQLFIDTWDTPRVLHIDFAKLGLETLPVDLSNCDITYEFAEVGEMIVLTTYHNQAAMDADAEFIQVALSHGAAKVKGLQCAVKFDRETSTKVRHAIINARTVK